MAEFTNDKKQPFLKNGKMVEKAFSDLFDNVSFPTKEEDMMEHWDLQITTKVDVKGLKKVKRENDEVNEHIHWIEVKGISGESGWAYGLADYFAFELTKYWIVVSKEKLQDFIKNNVTKEWVLKPELYKLYQRKDRKDVLTMVTSYDLCYISDCIIKKK